VVERRLKAVRHELPGVLAGEAESIHRMRVASRRLREALPLLAAAVAASGGADAPHRKIARALRRVTRALGGVRELDVALAFLDEIRASNPALAGAVAAVRQAVRWERDVRRRTMLSRLQRANLEKIKRRVSARLVDVQVAGPDPAWLTRLGRRIAVRAAGVEAAAEAAGDLYAPNRLHGVRIATKKLRYALELARELASLPTIGAVRRLKGMQDLLGRMHDLEVLAAHTRLLDLQASARGRLHVRIGALLDAIDREIRLLHAGYLARRPALAEVVERCRDEFSPKLKARGAIRTARRATQRETYGRNHHVVRRTARDRSRAGRRIPG
jgi:CHAD domain-containing protein